MAILRSTGPASLLLLALCAGCALLQHLGGPRRLAFDHELHVVGEEQTCVVCHGDFARSDSPGMPSPDTCAVCHDEIDEDKPSELRVASLFDGEVFRAAHAARLAEEVLFSHKRHARDPKSCGECHRGIESNNAIDSGIGVSMAACVACHAERDVVNDCADCHRAQRRDLAPSSHSRDWTRRHGRASRSCARPTADTCELCHGESTCIACHREEPPVSHNGFFRGRGHGLLAGLDRQGCAACHAPDSCDACHRETTPTAHTGSWGGTLARHCLGCHEPLQANGCAVCHRATPGHALAARKPAWHTPAMNCRQCHGLSLPLPHADNGGDCNACHG